MISHNKKNSTSYEIVKCYVGFWCNQITDRNIKSCPIKCYFYKGTGTGIDVDFTKRFENIFTESLLTVEVS